MPKAEQSHQQPILDVAWSDVSFKRLLSGCNCTVVLTISCDYMVITFYLVTTQFDFFANLGLMDLEFKLDV